MRIEILSIFPELFEPFLATSLIGRARQRGLLQVGVHDLRDHTTDAHRVVDDEPYGGGAGMVMLADPWLRAVRAASEASKGSAGGSPRRVLLSPRGRRLDEKGVRRLAAVAAADGLILLCGRYEGVDERVRDLVVDEEVSIGDFVLSGGEVPAMVLVEALSRQIPGVVGDPDSVENDSFRNGLLDYPHYTRPRSVEGVDVPAVLLSGDHAAIDAWRRRQSLLGTLRRRPDLLHGLRLQPGERRWLVAAASDEGLEEALPRDWLRDKMNG